MLKIKAFETSQNPCITAMDAYNDRIQLLMVQLFTVGFQRNAWQGNS